MLETLFSSQERDASDALIEEYVSRLEIKIGGTHGVKCGAVQT